MSLIFDIDKDKAIAMMVETSGIEDPSKLEFIFNIKVDGIKYGFPCKLKEGKVEICIPPLNTIIKKVKTGKYVASLDVTGDKNYFLQPFKEQVELKRQPKVDVIVDDNGDQSTVAEAITASISKIIDLDTDTIESSDSNSINTNNEVEPAPIKKSRVDKMFDN